MKRRLHTPEQITRKPCEADRLLSEGKTISETSEHLEVSAETFHRRRNPGGYDFGMWLFLVDQPDTLTELIH